jgi:hypothetical protein
MVLVDQVALGRQRKMLKNEAALDDFTSLSHFPLLSSVPLAKRPAAGLGIVKN